MICLNLIGFDLPAQNGADWELSNTILGSTFGGDFQSFYGVDWDALRQSAGERVGRSVPRPPGQNHRHQDPGIDAP